MGTGERGVTMSALDMIIQWAQEDLYVWQGDAVRRLLIQGSLSAEDENEIFTMLKEKKGIINPETLAKKPQPIKEGDISGAPSQKVKITLKSINNLRNVNAIPDGSNLPFGHHGLSVIYGENATGKSGYARVLKKACKARDIKERLLPNVFEPIRTGSAEASFKVSINDGADEDVPWQDGKEEEGILSNICVFDSKCARTIIDENNETTYLPYGAAIFPELVDLMKKIREKIEKEMPTPQTPEYPGIPPTTTAGKIIAGLTHETEKSFIESTAKWDKEKDEEKLTRLRKQVSDAESSDPTKAAKRLRNTKDRMNQLIENIDQISTALSSAKEEKIKEAISSLIDAEKALEIASLQEDISKAGPLKGIGEKAWQNLYNVAKEYSTSYAYPGKEFPVTEEGSVCVLCMQPLEDPAKERMTRFKNFMGKRARKDFENAQKDLKDAIREVEELSFATPESYKDLMDEFRDKYPEAIRQAEEFFPTMQTRAKELIKAANDKAISTFTAAKLNPKEAIGQIPKQLEIEAQETEKTVRPEELAQKIRKKEELESRKLFSQKRDEIIKYLEQLKLAHKYQQCYEETEFKGITVKGKTIIKKALTPQLKASLAGELKELGVEHLRIKLVPSGEEGQTMHKIDLETPQPLKKISLSEILSEGEHCVVGLAGFLAELQVADHECPIVLDDPVCSLDHKYMRKIAKRLAKEAEKRQVIIFTHDIAFLLELKEKAAESGKIFFTPQTVCRLDTIGKCMIGLPWHSMEVKERINYLREELDEIKSLYPTNMMEYNRKAAEIYGLLRETWEAFVEEKLLNKTIVRHGGEVQTMRLKCVFVSDDDYKKIHIAMHNCSTWMTGHDKSKNLNEERPSPREILKDIEELAQFSSEIGSRGQKLREEREEYLEPKQAIIG